MRVLVVRLGALGDILHAVPAAAAIRAAFPEAQVDWLVEARHRAMVDLVTVVDRVIAIDTRSLSGWIDAVRMLRGARYDAALDFQGLLKSAVLARASGAARVAGFSIYHLREKTARPFYSDTAETGDRRHVIAKNLRLLRAIGIDSETIAFPLARAASPALDALRSEIGHAPFALVNPGAAWPNKRWPADRFGELAAWIRDTQSLTPVVLWGPGEEALAREVAAASRDAAVVAPRTSLPDLLELARAAGLMVSGDTGPLHIAAAVGTPVVALFGPTDPLRNGPWAADDQTMSRYDECACHYKRRCTSPHWCLADVPVSEAAAATQRRRVLAAERRAG